MLTLSYLNSSRDRSTKCGIRHRAGTREENKATLSSILHGIFGEGGVLGLYGNRYCRVALRVDHNSVKASFTGSAKSYVLSLAVDDI